MAYLGNTPTQQGFTPAIDYFSGNASTTAFTLSRPVASVAQVQAVIENVPQNPGDAFTVSGNTITFTSAPPSGTNNIYVYYTSPITTFVGPWAQSQSGIYSYSNVGVGTASPANKLHVVGSAQTAAQIESTSTDVYLALKNSGGTSTFLGNTNAGAFIVQTPGSGYSTKLLVDSSGNVGIGTTSPSAKINAVSSGASYSGGTVAGIFQDSSGRGTIRVRSIIDDSAEIALDNNGALRWMFSARNSSEAYQLNLYPQASPTPSYGGVAAHVLSIQQNGNFAFNSGYGSAATAYGCRMWVNFRGTSTVIIRASGNVSSVSDDGTGSYTVNLTTAMPDINGSVTLGQAQTQSAAPTDNIIMAAMLTTTTIKVVTLDPNDSSQEDTEVCCVTLHR